MSDPWLDTLKSAISWPEGRSVPDRLSDIYAVLIGGAVSLVQCHRLLLLSFRAEAGEYQHHQLQTALLEMLDRDIDICWEHDNNFLAWSLGYFLNRSGHNVAAAFDRVTTELCLTIPELKQKAGKPMPSKLNSLAEESYASKLSCWDTISQMKELFDTNQASIRGAKKTLIKWATNIENRIETPGVLNRILDYVEAQGAPACLSVVWGRTNRFKHGEEETENWPLGLDRRKRLATEWVAAIYSLSLVGQLWRCCVSEGLMQKQG